MTEAIIPLIQENGALIVFLRQTERVWYLMEPVGIEWIAIANLYVRKSDVVIRFVKTF